MIGWLRSVLGAAFGRASAEPPAEPPRRLEFDRRLEAARERLKAAIPPRAD